MPTVRLDRTKPWSAKARVSDDDWLASFGQYCVQSSQKLSVCTGAIVPLEWEYSLVQADGTTFDRQCRPKHQPFTTQLKVRPIDENNGTPISKQERLGDRPIDTIPFALQVPISQKSINGLYLVLNVCGAVEASTKMSQRQLCASQQGPYHSHQRVRPSNMPDYCPITQPL
jgi:hypothetical protein